MNELNTRLRFIRIQLCMEEKKEEPNMETIELLKKEEEECLKRIM